MMRLYLLRENEWKFGVMKRNNEKKTSIQHYWRYRKKRKSYQRARLLFGGYLIIFSVLLLKELFQGLAAQGALETISYISSPINAIGWGWFSSIIVQSATIVAIFVNTLLGQDLMQIEPASFLMIGLILGNSGTPLFASLLIKSNKHWDIRHGFEIGFTNIIYSCVLAALILTLQLTTGIFTTTGDFLKTYLEEVTFISYLPTLLDIIVAPVFKLLHVNDWPWLVTLLLSIGLLIWAFQLFGDSITRYFGGVKRSQEKIKEHLGSKWRTFFIGLVLSCFIPSSSLLVTLLVPLAAKNLITLRQVIPYLIATNVATFIDVLVVAFANGAPGALAGAIVLMQMSILGVVFMVGPYGILVIHKLTRNFTMKVIPPRKMYITLFLVVYTLFPLILCFIPN